MGKTENETGLTDTAQPETGGEKKDEGKKVCQCYCVKRWIAPLANPDVPDPGFPRVETFWLRRIRIEIEMGGEFWIAEVKRKDYNCVTKEVLTEMVISANLARLRYLQVRTSRLVVTWATTWFGIPFISSIRWGPWRLLFRLPIPIGERDQLLSGGFTPWCPDDGVPCP